MKTFITILSISAIILAASSLLAQDSGKILGHIKPLPSEMLKKPIRLTACPGVVITEWRGSDYNKYSSQNPAAIQIMNTVCKESFKNFIPFVKRNGYNIKQQSFVQEVSLMPWNAFDKNGRVWGPGDGDDYRNLQDNVYRFHTRFSFGQTVYEQYGCTDRNVNHIFILNDVLDKEPGHPSFKEVFAHELFHAISNSWGLWARLDRTVSGRQKKDESLATEFGKFIYKIIDDSSPGRNKYNN